MTDQGITIVANAAITIVGMLIAAIPAIRALRQGQENGAKADAIGVKADAAKVAADNASTKADALAVQTQEIHEMTNGQLHSVTQELANANQKITDLHETVANQKIVASKPQC